MEFFENNQQPERALLVSVDTGAFDAETSIDELEELAQTAGARVLGKLVQRRDKPDSATCLGSGRLREAREFCEANEIDLLIFDGELTPSQQRNIEQAADVRVVDRTMLILDIFAARARSSEGKLQVELAQLKYRLPRLGGRGVQLSRLGGGIGTRGPGESKLESDRRHIRRRIDALASQLEVLQKRRANLHERRAKNGVESVAIVGYTNAGKSTLMNALTQAGVLVEDKLFATLDPTARALLLPDGRRILLVDTVGLVRRLPHQLVEAFQSTLEEAAYADVILNVCDASSPDCAEHLRVTDKVLDRLGCAGKPVIQVLNKCDLAHGLEEIPYIGRAVRISALRREGLDQLLRAVEQALPPSRREAELLLPFSQGSLAARLRREGAVLEEEYRDAGLYLRVIADLRLLDELKAYLL